MKNKVKLIIIALILLVLAALYSIIDKNNSIYDMKTDSADFVLLEMEEGDTVVQTFSTKEKTLDGIAIKILASGTVENISLSYELQENSKTVVSGQTSLADLKNGKFFRIGFDRLEDCADKEYVFSMTLEACAEDDEVTVYYTKDIEDNTSLFNNEKEIEGTMVLRTVTRRFDMETFVVTIVFILYIVAFMKWLSKMFK